MTCSWIRGHQELLREGRGFFDYGPRRGQAYPPHPVKILDIGQVQELPPPPAPLSSAPLAASVQKK
jgi:hypothetical protein